jgi:hypothetical protein
LVLEFKLDYMQVLNGIYQDFLEREAYFMPGKFLNILEPSSISISTSRDLIIRKEAQSINQ